MPEFTALENVLMPYVIENGKASAEVLIRAEELIMADEPTGNIDSKSTENIFRNVNEKFKTTFVVITHDRRIAEKADRIIEIKDGRTSMDIYK